jgi:hypothetical protein
MFSIECRQRRQRSRRGRLQRGSVATMGNNVFGTTRVALTPVAFTQTLYLALQPFSDMRLLAGECDRVQ